MKLIDEVKKLRDECKKEEEYYNERFNLWMQYKGESWPDLPSDSSACQSVGAIRAKLDRIISEYHPESETQLGYWEPISPILEDVRMDLEICEIEGWDKTEYIKQLKKLLDSIQPEQRWIPCSERLPEKDGYYLTTTCYRQVYCDFWNEDHFDRTERVIAWMPLPEPYPAERKGQ